MPVFKYSAYNRQKTLVKEEVEAPDERAARAKIRDLGYFPVELKQVGRRRNVSVGGMLEEASQLRKQVQQVFSDQAEQLQVFSYRATAADSAKSESNSTSSATNGPVRLFKTWNTPRMRPSWALIGNVSRFRVV